MTIQPFRPEGILDDGQVFPHYPKTDTNHGQASPERFGQRSANGNPMDSPYPTGRRALEPAKFRDTQETPMPILDDLRSLYQYTRWADTILLDAVGQLTPEAYVQEPAPGWAPVRSSLIHMGGAMRIWKSRLQHASITSFPDEIQFPSVDDAAKLLHEGHDAFDQLVAALSPEQSNALFTYSDLKGNSRTIPYWAVYRHVANHQTYHRGQVVSKLKRLGVDTPATDFIYWAASQ